MFVVSEHEDDGGEKEGGMFERGDRCGMESGDRFGSASRWQRAPVGTFLGFAPHCRPPFYSLGSRNFYVISSHKRTNYLRGFSGKQSPRFILSIIHG